MHLVVQATYVNFTPPKQNSISIQKSPGSPANDTWMRHMDGEIKNMNCHMGQRQRILLLGISIIKEVQLCYI